MSYEITGDVGTGLTPGASTKFKFLSKDLKDCILYDHNGSFSNGMTGVGTTSAYILIYNTNFKFNNR